MRRIIVSLSALIAAVVAMAAASTAPAFAVVMNPGPDGSGNVTPSLGQPPWHGHLGDRAHSGRRGGCRVRGQRRPHHHPAAFRPAPGGRLATPAGTPVRPSSPSRLLPLSPRPR